MKYHFKEIDYSILFYKFNIKYENVIHNVYYIHNDNDNMEINIYSLSDNLTYELKILLSLNIKESLFYKFNTSLSLYKFNTSLYKLVFFNEIKKYLLNKI